MSIDYHRQIQAYESEKVNLPESIRKDLYSKRDANQGRLRANLPERIKIKDFISQGSMAIRTTVQEKDFGYDIDDGVRFHADSLKGEWLGFDLTPDEVKEMVHDALKDDDRFANEPEIMDNCVRVFYSEGYHVDIPAYRVHNPDTDDERQELAGKDGWVSSDPKEITVWFEERVQELNKLQDGAGSQFRRMVRLLKRFARSRGDKWDMPSGLKLTMLCEECFAHSADRDDKAFQATLQKMSERLKKSLVVFNRAQSKSTQDKLTRSDSDANMLELRKRITEALEKLAVIWTAEDKKSVRDAWDWVFQTDGFFEKFDKDDGDGPDGVASRAPEAPFIKSPTRFG